ncbi:MAG: TatD family hydrolase [Gallionella sp.]|nr:TatD family hydrolase [Gallionella sp.]
MLIDTHCHLDAAEFGADQDKLLHAAHLAGVTRLVVPAVERAGFAGVRTLCERYPACSPAYGIHPMYVPQAHKDDLIVLRDYLRDGQPVAIGEIGLDFYIEHYDHAQQEYFFVEQLKLAREFDLPVLLHIRRAQDTVLKHLRRFYGSNNAPSNRLRAGIAHAFSGSRQQADEFIKLGFSLGFGGAMTYPRATRLRELAATLPLSSIVLETDAPDMPPAFIERGSPNKPEYLQRIAETLAELRGISAEEIAQATTENALAVLPKLNIPTVTLPSEQTPSA